MSKPSHINIGAGWLRPDGTRIEPGEHFVPTEDELIRKRHKIEPLVTQVPASPPPARPVVHDDRGTAPLPIAWGVDMADEDETDGDSD